MQYRLGVIGAGNMAEAIVRGLLKSGLFAPSEVIAADLSPQRRELFSNELGVVTTDDPAIAAKSSACLLLSVKPQQMEDVLASLSAHVDAQTLVVSIAAGIGTGFIESRLADGKGVRVVRTMPNTPMMVGDGMVGIAAGSAATQADIATVRKMFEPAARVLEVAEADLDAVTAISGSGPAYFFYLVQQMAAAGVELGLDPTDAHLLASQTALGAAKMLLGSPDSPEELRRKVTSPGGTTAAAITSLESAGVGEAIRAAIHAAHRRSRELGR